jgi:regulator of replication initiation timing
MKGNLPPEVSEHMNKLDKEVKRLRFALGETLKMNALLQNELQKLREETNEGNGALVNNNSVTSPAIQDFSETFKEIHNCEKNRKQSAFTLPRITNSSSK